MINKNEVRFLESIKSKSIFYQSKYPLLFYFIKWLLISIFISIPIGTVSALFLTTLNWVTNFREEHIWIIWFLPLVGLAIGLLYQKYGKEVETGNNLIIDQINEKSQIEVIPFKMAPLIYLSTLFTHLFGGSAGREGTALQMSASIADQISKPFQLNTNDRKGILLAAVAGGFGSVFGTPFAGAIFAIEFTKRGVLRYQFIFPAIMTALFSNWITTLWQVPHTHYTINTIVDISIKNIIYAMSAGILFGLCAFIFSKSLNLTTRIFKKYITYAPIRPFIGGLLIVLAIYLFGTTKYIGLGIPTIIESFQTPLNSYDFAIKMIFTILTLSSGFKGGEVTPLFFIGAALGSALSLFIPLPFTMLAGLGFVAVFAGATNTPLASSIMFIELFGYSGLTFAGIVCFASYLCSGNTSIYLSQIKFNN